jgi:hypothetical protein
LRNGVATAVSSYAGWGSLWRMAGTSRTAPIADALGRALRDARLSTPGRPSAAAVSKELGWPAPSRLTRYEGGSRAPQPEDVEEILNALVRLGLELSNEQRKQILDLAQGVENPAWFAVTLPEQQRQLTTLLDYEDIASEIVVASPLLIPGLCQTNKYARAIIGNAEVPPSEIQMRVAVRMGRRDALMRDNPVRLTAIIDEPVLHRRIGGPAVMLEQLRFLLQLAERPNIDLHVIPADSDYHDALTGPFVLVKFPEAPPVVHLETKTSGLFLHEEKDVAPYLAASDRVLRAAMSEEPSLELIASEAKQIEETISR